MSKIVFFLLFATLGFCQELDVAKVSEAMGHLIAKNLQDLGLDLDLDAVVKGLQDNAEGKHSPLSEEECAQAINALQEEKMLITSEKDLKRADAVSNGDLLPEKEFPSLR